MDRMAVHVLVTGRVQGVGFRQWTVDEGLALGLSGWVRNRPDGRVEAVLEGDRDALLTLVERMRRGPRAARVREVRTLAEEAHGLSGLRIAPTGDA